MEPPLIGARILGPLLSDHGSIIAIVRSHHERLDGKGLPDGLKGDQIPILVRAVSVADAFDAMTSERPYRPSLPVERALTELRDGNNVQFDPDVGSRGDARPSRPMFARDAAAGLMSVGGDVIDVGLVSTPTAQLAVEHHRAAGGVVLTASHNPIEWNALKFVGPDGIFLDQNGGARVVTLAADGRLERAGFGTLGDVASDDAATARHLDAVLRLKAVDVRGIRRHRFRVALDTVRGAGGVIMPVLLERLGCRVAGVNLEPDGRFPRPPEPIPEHLEVLGKVVRRSKAEVGFAVDPDVDRLAIVDERGRPIGEDYTLAFAVRAVLGGKAVGRKGGKHTVVCNLSTSLVVDDAARECGAEVIRAPVGEAHVARAMLAARSPVGGEGNGGVILPALHVGRDGPVAAALALTLLARTGKTVSELVAAAPRYVIVKDKVQRGAGDREQWLAEVYAALRRRFPDAAADTRDGLRRGW